MFSSPLLSASVGSRAYTGSCSEVVILINLRSIVRAQVVGSDLSTGHKLGLGFRIPDTLDFFVPFFMCLGLDSAF